MTGPCAVWDLDDACSDIPEGTPEEVVLQWQTVATELLWAASGRRYGLCEVTVRPCLRSCFSGALPSPYRDASGWHNWCGCATDCSCSRLCAIVLEGPVSEVVSVTIDGTELQEENYRLDLVGSRYELVRTDGGCFPSCQDMSVDCEAEGSFCVSYLKGMPLSDLAIAAVTELTSELVKACTPACRTCKLPKNATSIVRRGITITLSMLKSWFDALPMVEAFVESANPYGLTSSSDVFSPDLPPWRQTVAPPTS